jgi:hypothetical protein
MTWNALRRGLTALILLAIAGCVVPVLSGDKPESRVNVGGSVPGFITVGSTSRSDVLLALGEPDGVTEGGDQFVYTRISGKGGIWFGSLRGGAQIERMQYRRLVILFDDAGRVKNARIDDQTCTSSQQDGATRYQCVDVAGRDLARTDPGDAMQAEAQAEELAHGQAFAPAQWLPGVSGFDAYQASAPIEGSFVVGQSCVMFLPPGTDGRAAPLTKLAYAQIEGVYVASSGLNRRLVIRRVDGRSDSFSFGGFLVDRKATQAAGVLVESRWKAAAAKARETSR